MRSHLIVRLDGGAFLLLVIARCVLGDGVSRGLETTAAAEETTSKEGAARSFDYYPKGLLDCNDVSLRSRMPIHSNTGKGKSNPGGAYLECLELWSEKQQEERVRFTTRAPTRKTPLWHTYPPFTTWEPEVHRHEEEESFLTEFLAKGKNVRWALLGLFWFLVFCYVCYARSKRRGGGVGDQEDGDQEDESTRGNVVAAAVEEGPPIVPPPDFEVVQTKHRALFFRGSS